MASEAGSTSRGGLAFLYHQPSRPLLSMFSTPSPMESMRWPVAAGHLFSSSPVLPRRTVFLITLVTF